MSVATTELSRSTQHLIDSRLDTIDRMLLGRVSRQERLEIVREVEAQIFEQLFARGLDEPSREDVLAVLGRLDPPEAYLAEEDGDLSPAAHRVGPTPRHRPIPSASGAADPSARISGILSLVAISLLLLAVPLTFALAVLLQSEAVLFIIGGAVVVLTLIVSIVGIVLAARCRLSSAWAVVGLVNGILSILGAICAPVSFLVLF
jgi:hypothetical protein